MLFAFGNVRGSVLWKSSEASALFGSTKLLFFDAESRKISKSKQALKNEMALQAAMAKDGIDNDPFALPLNNDPNVFPKDTVGGSKYKRIGEAFMDDLDALPLKDPEDFMKGDDTPTKQPDTYIMQNGGGDTRPKSQNIIIKILKGIGITLIVILVIAFILTIILTILNFYFGWIIDWLRNRG